MLNDVSLEIAILDYICKTAGDNHLDLIERIRIETERNFPPEPKLWELPELGTPQKPRFDESGFMKTEDSDIAYPLRTLDILEGSVPTKPEDVNDKN